jgi:hypothetical protein
MSVPARALAIVLIACAWAAPVLADGRASDAALAAQARTLDLLERAGRAADGKRFAEAARLYRKAAALDPGDGQALVLAGVAAYQIPAPRAARRDLERALARRLGPDDRELAELYLGLIAQERAGDQAVRPDGGEDGAADQLWTVAISTTVGGGYDSNARQTPPGSLDAEGVGFAPAQGAVYASASIELGLSRGFRTGTSVELTYVIDQSAYQDRSFADLDFQEHTVALELAQTLGPDARVALTATGDLSFTGVGTELRPFQRSLRLDPELVIGASAVRVRVGGAWQRISTLDPALAHLSGQRLEASLSPQLSLAGWRASVTGRLRRDDLGSVHVGAEPSPDGLCLDCITDTVVPYSNQGVGASARLSAPFRWRLRPSLSGRWELRSYDRPQRTQRVGASGLETLGSRIRQDIRLGVGASVALRLGPACTLTARYDHLRLSSSYQELQAARCPQGDSCDASAGDRRGYRKHGLTLELSIDWS